MFVSSFLLLSNISYFLSIKVELFDLVESFTFHGVETFVFDLRRMFERFKIFRAV